MRFWIDVENASGARQGAGPIATATQWRHIARLDRAGEVQFTMPANDPAAALVVDHPKRVVRCKGQRPADGAIIDFGAGLVETWSIKPDTAGATQLSVAGGDLLRELTHRSVGFLAIADSGGAPVTTGLASILAKAPTWALDPSGYSSTGVLDYGAFAGELVLDALGKLAAHTGQHFRLAASGRYVRWLRSALVLSGMRAVRGGDSVALADNHDVCLIADIEEVADGYDLLTRVYPFGAGNADNRLTLAHTNRTPPTGYTLSVSTNELINTAAETALGLRIERYLSWKEIGPISNSDTDLQSAANVLFDAALRELQIRSVVQHAYTLRVTKCDFILYPGQTLRVVYQGWFQIVDHSGTPSGNYHYLNIDQDLVILETTTEIDGAGLRTVGLLVSTVAAWPTSAAELTADELAAGRLMEAHPQLTIAYAPLGPYTRRMDISHDAEFIVRIGKEVTALNYAILRFKTSPLVSSVKSLSGASGGASTVTSASGGSSTPTSSSGGSSTPTSGNQSGGHYHNIVLGNSTSGTIVYFTGGNLVTSGGGEGGGTTDEDANHTHNVSIGSHTHNVSIGSHTHGVDVPDHSHAITAAYGIYQDTVYPTTIFLEIDGVARGEALGGPWAAGGAAVDVELDITTYLVNASGGLRQNHSIKFSCTSGQGEIEAEIDMLVSIQAIAVV